MMKPILTQKFVKVDNEHEKRMINFVKIYNLENKGFEFITNGYFFTKFFICQGKESLIVDLNKKISY